MLAGVINPRDQVSAHKFTMKRTGHGFYENNNNAA
jgi:hypothetical protein